MSAAWPALPYRIRRDPGILIPMPREYNPEETVTFVNITGRDFKCRYDGKMYLIPKESRNPFRVPVAQHFAKHLADQILQEQYDKESIRLKDPLRRNRSRLWIDPDRPKLYAKMIPEFADDLEEQVHAAEELVVKMDAKEGLQPVSTGASPTKTEA